MNLSEIKRILAADQIQLTKSLGQNFLHDANQLGRIVSEAELSEDEKVLEIGPGLGALTQLLLEKGPVVRAIEKDKRLYAQLQARFGNNPKLELIRADALERMADHSTDWSEWTMVSNLPYSVASPILVELAKANGAPRRMVVTLQWEVARRLAARPADDEYGVLTLLVQLRYQPVNLFKIPPTCFFPVPNIESGCVTLVRRPDVLLEPLLHRAFEKIVKRGFSQRRKMMLKLLKADWPPPRIEQAFAALEISPQARAETVSLEQYVRMTEILTSPAAPDL